MNTHYDTVRYKQVLVPLWKARYGYAGKTYHYMINGENGKEIGRASCRERV